MFTGTFAGGSSAIFAKQSGNTVNFYVGGSSWGSSLALGSGWDALGAGDFNGDGKADVLRINDGGYVVAELSNGSGSFTPQVLNMKGVGWCAAGIGDFNGNGKDDIAMINGSGVVDIWRVVDGVMQSDSVLSMVDTSAWEFAGVGDFNGDGTDDIAWCNTETGLAGYWQNNNNQLTTWANIATLG